MPEPPQLAPFDVKVTDTKIAAHFFWRDVVVREENNRGI